ncbi:MAG: hypothetical protein COX79_02275 [Candidatus Levybacteria bacterium CG_4_10_14_0_2_um_filter_36_16]|nr:MAG: hypothetical protein AUK12_00790 [Candidatus Levybacteria bacterium CG2_30_37_29]PIZ97449.1 MAG: hypothetical protein COX79_02275 [Candidatus Levybacteria bacterium CG_4_10_14_0_2_um_filter_36_16]
MKLSIVILTYNTKKLTLECIDSIIKNYKDEIEEKIIEIIVVDNASSDGTANSLSGKKYVNMFCNTENSGFSKGCNLGAEKAKGKYLLFLNSDTKTFDKGFIKMTDFLDANENVAILGGGLTNTDGTKQKTAGNFYNLFNLSLVLAGFERFGLIRKYPKNITQVDWVGGGCMMVRCDVFEKLWGFDPRIFMYMEDMEFCFRAKKMGYLTFFFPDIKVEHSQHKSSNRGFAIEHIYKGILYFYKKHTNYFEYLFVKILLIIKAIVAIFVGFTFNKDYLRKTYMSAIKNIL